MTVSSFKEAILAAISNVNVGCECYVACS